MQSPRCFPLGCPTECRMPSDRLWPPSPKSRLHHW